MKRIAAIVMFIAATAMQSLGDGKMFWREKIHPKIPYQRALILFDEGMTAHDRLTLRFAGEMRKHSLELLPADSEPQGFFDQKKMDFPYLCKFKDRLTPERMKEDIIFSEAENNESYREHVVKW